MAHSILHEKLEISRNKQFNNEQVHEKKLTYCIFTFSLVRIK